MKKKVLFAILIMAVALTACNGKAGEEKDAVDTSAAGEAMTEEPEAEKEERIVEDDSDGESKADAEDGFVKGTVSDTGWESEYLGIRYTLPEGMLMATEEELNEIMGLGAEALAGDFSELQLKYAQMRTVYEMMSTDAIGTVNVVMTVEKLPLSSMKAEQYVQSLERGLEQLSAISYTVLSDDERVEIAGRDFIKVSAQAEDGNGAKNQDYYVHVVDGRAVCMVITYLDETAEQAEMVMNAFTPY